MAVENLAQFEKEMRQLVIELPEKQIVPFQKKIVLDLLRRVVNKTPVDTGRARANWQVTIGAPAEGEVSFSVEGPERAKGKGSRKANRLLKREVHRQVSRGIATATQKLALGALNGLGRFQDAFITNNVPYIVFLEKGSSKQAPKGMVGVSVQEISHIFP